MTISDDTYARRRWLPHLERDGKTYFVTFRTHESFVLSAEARDIALACVVQDHLRTFWLDTAVVMPDHIHMLITPFDEYRLSQIMNRVKNVSAHYINALLGRHGPLWHREYFDHILRSDESRRIKGEYIVMNPVRKGLVNTPDDYRWIYRSWIEGEQNAAEVGGGTR